MQILAFQKAIILYNIYKMFSWFFMFALSVTCVITIVPTAGFQTIREA